MSRGTLMYPFHGGANHPSSREQERCWSIQVTAMHVKRYTHVPFSWWHTGWPYRWSRVLTHLNLLCVVLICSKTCRGRTPLCGCWCTHTQQAGTVGSPMCSMRSTHPIHGPAQGQLPSSRPCMLHLGSCRSTPPLSQLHTLAIKNNLQHGKTNRTGVHTQ
jgi:hypothetical protein